MSQMKEPSEKEKLEGELRLLEKQHLHAVGALGMRLSPLDRKITEDLVNSLSKQIIALENRIKSLEDSK